ncbi:MAG TPA: DNRLRE domain-containing protein, partial [Hyphomicrobiaceae bacterium]|nr:DNRLRE domain-containing protein [Hyphomicrobiaceae bacterium]
MLEANYALASSTPSPKPPAAHADIFKATTARQGNRQSGPGKQAADKEKEIPSMRSGNSRTMATSNGYVTDIFAGPINFKDSKGTWQPIDDTLVAAGVSGYAAKNRANEYTALLPASLTAPIRLILPSGTIEIGLVGASGAPTIKVNVATYANALPGATVAYEVQPESLKESITLVSALSPSLFTYSLTLPANWSAKSNVRGGIDLKDSKGQLQAALVPPTMTDAARQTGPVAMSLSTTSGLLTITVNADVKWLRGAGRKFPVVIDPTIWTQTYYFLGQDCDLSSANPNTNLCSSYQYAGSTDFVGFNGADVDRAMYLFPILAGSPIYDHTVPNANILDAELDLTLHSAQPSAVPISIYPVTQSWSDTGATWNKADSTHAWTTPGGTVGAAISTLNVGPALSMYAFTGITQTIQNWVNGAAANYGLMIRAANESQGGTTVEFNNQKFDTADVDDAGNPHLHVRWNAWGGLQPMFKFDGTKQLDDRMSIAVNVANGQLVVHNQDIAVRGVGLNLAIDRYYNSLSATQFDLGNGWNLNIDCQVEIDTSANDGVVYYAPDGYAVLFRNNGSGGYITPAGINADLVKNGNGTFTLTFHGSNTKFDFQSGG